MTLRSTASLLALLVLPLLGGCQATGEAATDSGSTGSQRQPVLDFGQDWDANDPAWMSGGESGAAGGGVAGADGSVWAIVLRTFTEQEVGDGHRSFATNMVADLPQIDPRLRTAWVHTSGRGSMVLFGRYEAPDDAAAQRDLAWIKSIEPPPAAVAPGQQAPMKRLVFPRAMIGRVQVAAGAASPFELRLVRRQHPDVDPLYTLAVAVWGTFGGDMTWAEAQRRAEAQVQRLRAEGLPAYVHRDGDREEAMVTVGLFDHRAVDQRSGLFSPEVDHLMGRFEHYLVNGEPISTPLVRQQPGLGTQVQRPMLVLVPRL